MKKFILFFIVLPMTYISFFSEKARLDREVKRLCAIDGGIKVYETVKLPVDRFDKDGSVRILAKSLAKPIDEYYYKSSKRYQKKGNPELWQSNYKIYRRSDNKLLGESILYVRRGGDIPGPWHPSSFSCPKNTDLSRHIFIQSNGE